MTHDVRIQPISAEAFAPFGDLIDCDGAPDKIINQGMCGRFNDRAQLDFSDGNAGISLFNAELRNLPLKLEMMERHPDGSQAFIPMAYVGFLVVVASDDDGKPGTPLAFETHPGQAINFHRGVWHGVLTPLNAPGLFAVVDRIGAGENLEEHWFMNSWTISN
jgi:ureidoglycolate lyase